MKIIQILFSLIILGILYSCSSDKKVVFQTYEIIVPSDSLPENITEHISALANLKNIGDSLIVFPTISIRSMGADSVYPIINKPIPRAQTNPSNLKFLKASLKKQLKGNTWVNLNEQVSKKNLNGSLEEEITDEILKAVQKSKSRVFVLSEDPLNIDGVQHITQVDEIPDLLFYTAQDINHAFIFIFPLETANIRPVFTSKNTEASILNMDHEKLKELDGQIAQQLILNPSDPMLWYERALINVKLSKLFDGRLFLEYATEFIIRQGDNLAFYDRVNTAQRDILRPLFSKFPRHMEAILFALKYQIECVVGVAPYFLYDSPKKGYKTLNVFVDDQLYTNSHNGLRILCTLKDYDGSVQLAVSLPRYKDSPEVNIIKTLPLGQSIYHEDSTWTLEVINDSPLDCPEHVRLLVKIDRTKF
jgi:hypothetical protein